MRKPRPHSQAKFGPKQQAIGRRKAGLSSSGFATSIFKWRGPKKCPFSSANRTVVEPNWSECVLIWSSLCRAPQSGVILLGEGKRPCPTRIISASIALMTILKNLRSLTTSDHRAQPKNVCVANKWCAYCHKISCAQHAHNLLNMERHQNQLGPSLIIG